MDIKNLLQEFIEDNGSVGASVAVIENGKTSFYTYGKKSVNGNDLVSKDTLFEIGSITKVFTTLLLAEMESQGRVKLDEPVEKYLPGVKIPERNGKKITFRHLATHTSGLSRMPDNFAPKDPSNPYQDYTVELLFEFLKSYTLTRDPGESFEYSNLGMGLLGYVLSVRYGKSYEEMVKDLITNKLNMLSTSVSLSGKMAENFASGHSLGKEVKSWDFTPSIVGAGGIRSNIKDMANFLAMSMGNSKSSIYKSFSLCFKQEYSENPNFAIGLGWMLSNSDEAKLVFHQGQTGGFKNYLGFNPKLKKGVVVLSNSTESWIDELGCLVLDPGYKQPVVDKSLTNDPEYLSKFVGHYIVTIPGSPEWELTIFVRRKNLECCVFEASLGTSYPMWTLYPESYGIFGIMGGLDASGERMKIFFSFNKAENIEKMEVRVTNGTVLWEAVPQLQL